MDQHNPAIPTRRKTDNVLEHTVTAAVSPSNTRLYRSSKYPHRQLVGDVVLDFADHQTGSKNSRSAADASAEASRRAWIETWIRAQQQQWKHLHSAIEDVVNDGAAGRGERLREDLHPAVSVATIRAVQNDHHENGHRHAATTQSAKPKSEKWDCQELAALGSWTDEKPR